MVPLNLTAVSNSSDSRGPLGSWQLSCLFIHGRAVSANIEVIVLNLSVGSNVSELIKLEIPSWLTISLLHRHDSTSSLVSSCPEDDLCVSWVVVNELGGVERVVIAWCVGKLSPLVGPVNLRALLVVLDSQPLDVLVLAISEREVEVFFSVEVVRLIVIEATPSVVLGCCLFSRVCPLKGHEIYDDGVCRVQVHEQRLAITHAKDGDSLFVAGPLAA